MRSCSLLLIRWDNGWPAFQGCDSGFGHELAKQLSCRGVTVFAGVLDANGAGAQQLQEYQQQQQQPDLLQVLQLDVTDSAQVEAAHKLISRQVADTGKSHLPTPASLWPSSPTLLSVEGLWALVNNAGVLLCPVDAEIQPLADYRRCMDINFLATVRMCQTFLPLLRRSRGRVVNVSSMAGKSVCFLRGVISRGI